MPSNSYPLIAKEGWLVLCVLIGVYTGLQFLQVHLLLDLLFLVIILIAFYLHRDPYQQVPALPLAVVSPVHGTIESITEMEDPFLKRPVKCIRITMQPWDIFSLRSVTEGKVMEQWLRNQDHSDAGKRCYAFWIQTDEADHVVTAIHLQQQRWRYRFYMQSGERLGQGQRCGFLYFGATIDVMVPVESRLEVEVGQRVRSGASTLAFIVHERAVSAYDGPNRSSLATA